MADEVVEKFRPTSGRVLGVIALLMVAAIVVVSLVDRAHGFPPIVVWSALFVGVLVWAAMLRPLLWITTTSLVMRNMLSTVSIPLAAIEQVVVRQVCAVRAGEQRYVSPAIGKSWRQSLRSNRGRKPATSASYPEFVEGRIRQLADDARARAGVANLSDEQLALAAGVRRDRAWPELAALVVTVVGIVVSAAL